MSNRELAKSLIDRLPKEKLVYIIAYLQEAVIPENYLEEFPNKETLDTIAEVDEMIRTGNGQHFRGSTEDFMNMLLEEN